jgi:hypothetical protein
MHISRFYALGLTFFTLSWLAYDHYRPWVNFHAELLAFLGLWGALMGVALRCKGILAIPRIGLAVAIVASVPWWQYAADVNFFVGDALMSSFYLSGLFAAIFVGANLFHAESGSVTYPVVGVFHTLWVAALVSAAIGLAQWLNVDSALGMYVVQSDLGDRAMGNLGQPNQLATLLLMGMAALAFVYERGTIGRFAFGLGIAFLTVVLILAQSRAGMVSVFIISTYLIWKNKTVKSKVPVNALVWWAICFFLGALALQYISEWVMLSDVRSMRSPDAINQRFRIWQQVGYAVLQQPWTGYGWNQTPAAHSVGALAFPGVVSYTYAHNFIMDMLAWNGLPLGVFLTGGIAYWFATRIYASKHISTVYALACLLPISVHSMFEYPFAYAYFLIGAGLLVGVVEAEPIRLKGVSLNRKLLWGYVSLSATIGMILTYEYIKIEEDFRVVRFENLRIGQTPEAYIPPQVWLLSHMGAMLRSRRLAIEPNMQLADLETLRLVSLRFSDNVPHFRYALALALNGLPVEAAHQLTIIRGMFGEYYYRSCVAELQRLRNARYPQLVEILSLTDQLNNVTGR